MLRSLFSTGAFINSKNQIRKISRHTNNLEQSNHSNLLITAGKPIAYEKLRSKSKDSPCVIYIPGWMSGKDGDKAQFLRNYCAEKNYSYVRYDPSSIGDSPGELGSIRFSDWVSNAFSVLTHLGEKNNILIGSSLGAWISILVAMKVQDKTIKGLILIAPAVNIFTPYYKLVMPKLSKEVVELLDRGEVHTLVDEQLGEFQVWKALIENIEEFEIDVGRQIPISCPVRILHGCEDVTIPFSASIDMMKSLASRDVEVVLRKSAEHDFKEPESLSILAETLDKLVAKTRMTCNS